MNKILKKINNKFADLEPEQPITETVKIVDSPAKDFRVDPMANFPKIPLEKLPESNRSS